MEAYSKMIQDPTHRHAWKTVAGTVWAAPAYGPVAVTYQETCSCGAWSRCIVRHPGAKGRVERTISLDDC